MSRVLRVGLALALFVAGPAMAERRTCFAEDQTPCDCNVSTPCEALRVPTGPWLEGCVEKATGNGDVETTFTCLELEGGQLVELVRKRNQSDTKMGLNFSHSTVRGLTNFQSHTPRHGLTIKKSRFEPEAASFETKILEMRGGTSTGELVIEDSQLNGRVYAREVKLESLSFYGSGISGELVLDLAEIRSLDVRDASLGGAVSCRKCTLTGLSAQDSSFESEVLFEGSTVSGKADFEGAHLDRGLSWASVTGGSVLVLDGAHAKGTIQVAGGELESLSIGRDGRPSEIAVLSVSHTRMDHLQIHGSVFSERVDIRDTEFSSQGHAIEIQHATFLHPIRIQRNDIDGRLVIRDVLFTKNLVLEMDPGRGALELTGVDWNALQTASDRVAKLESKPNVIDREGLLAFSASLRARGDLVSANEMLYGWHRARMVDNWTTITSRALFSAAGVRALIIWVWDAVGWVLSGFTTQFWQVAAWLVLTSFALSLQLRRRATLVRLTAGDPRPFGIWPVLREGPSAFLTAENGEPVDDWMTALRLGFSVVLKVPLTDAYLRSSGRDMNRSILISAWLIGAALIGYGVITIKNTQPLAHLLLVGAFN